MTGQGSMRASNAAALHAADRSVVELWRDLKPTYPELSAPFLVDPPLGYWETDRLLICGQETCGWAESLDAESSVDSLITALKAEYRSAELGVRWQYTPFWRGTAKISRALLKGVERPPFIWTNLVKCDARRRRPPKEVEERVATVPLLGAEMEAYAPSVVIFFTGPRYDERLKAALPGTALESDGRFVARVAHPSLPAKSYRTYHPNYLSRSKNWDVLDQLIRLCLPT